MPEGLRAVDVDDERVPVLLAVSDNGAAMTAHSTREFMARCSIAQHFGRPGVPTDQAHIETLRGHVKAEWPHLASITDAAVLSAELERVRAEYNGVRLHEAIGYVTPTTSTRAEGNGYRPGSRGWRVPLRPVRITDVEPRTTARRPPHDVE
ncbi:MAG: integrase core domain-containing protein [Actinomycetota bacterium]|nr:integrase core domain-containing protein [Actinomycetota bacterium]